MALPDASLHPDDPTYKGKTWDAVEKALNDRDQFLASASGYGAELTEARGPTALEPCKPKLSKFPWEERVEPFAKPASCKFENWRHTCLKFTLGKQTATLQFNAAASNNAFDPDMLDALQDAIMDLRGRQEVRVVVLRSEGKLFSNGFNPQYLMSESSKTTEQITAVQLQFAKILYFLQNLPQLTVALIQGTAMGAAVGLVCACDMVYAVRGAYFAMSETKIGAVPSTSIPYITRRITYFKDAYQLILVGASLSAETAREYGLVTAVVDDTAALEAECRTLCDRMTMCAPGAVAATKEVVLHTIGVPPSSFMMNYVASVVAEVSRSPEARGGIEAIQSRRKPAWVDAPIAP